jgi:hypothetical protein
MSTPCDKESKNNNNVLKDMINQIYLENIKKRLLSDIVKVYYTLIIRSVIFLNYL